MLKDNKSLCIVMVDDDRDDIFLTKMAFKKAGINTQFIGLETGDSLFKHIKDNGIGSIDLLLLDVNMPIQDGHDVLARLSAYPHFSDLCVIMFSTSRRPLDKSVSEQLGATNFIVKPSTTKETDDFIQTVTEALKSREYAIAS